MKLSKKLFIFMGISSISLVAYPAYIYSSSSNHNIKPTPKYHKNIFKTYMDSISMDQTFSFVTNVDQISVGIKASDINSDAVQGSVYYKIYNQIVSSYYSLMIKNINDKLIVSVGPQKTRLTSILNSIKYYQSNKYFKFQFSSDKNIIPGFSTLMNLKLIPKNSSPIDAGSFNLNTQMTDNQKGISTTYWFSKQVFTEISLGIDDSDHLIKNYSDKLKTAIEDSPQFKNINPVYQNIFKQKELIIQPNDPTAKFIPNDLIGNYKILFKYKGSSFTPFDITAAATNDQYNAYLGTWSNQTKKMQFLQMSDVGVINSSLFLNEPGLTSISIRHGELQGGSILGGATNVKVLKLDNPKIINIGRLQFYNGGTSALSTLDLQGSKNIETIGDGAFRFQEINIINGLDNLKYLKTIGLESFQQVKIKNINLSNNISLVSIGFHAFGNEAFESINLSGNLKLKDINSDAFSRNLGSIKSLNLQGCASLTNLTAFASNKYYENLNSLDLSGMKSLASIPTKFFEKAKIKEIKLSGAISLTTIGDKAFPKNVYTSIDFSGDGKLQNLYNGFIYDNGSITKFDLSGCASMTSLLPFSWQTTTGKYYFDAVVDFNISGMSALTSIPKYFADRSSHIRKLDLSGLTSLKESGIDGSGSPFRDVPNSSDVSVTAWKGLLDTPQKKTNLFTDKWNKMQFSYWTAGKVVKPIVAGGTISGLNGNAVYTPPTLENVTIKVNKTTGLSNGDTVYLSYNLNPGYVWSDESAMPITLTYKVENLNIGVVKPIVAGGSVTGVSGKGIYTPPTLTGTTITANKTTGLSNGDNIQVTYNLNNGYVWNDGTTEKITLIYIVNNLNIPVIKPTVAGGSISGLNGKGIYTPPTLTGTTVTADKTTNLSNNDEIKVTYALESGYAWNDGKTDSIILTYKVENLKTGVMKPTIAGGSVSGVSGKGVYTPPTLKGTTVTANKTTGLSNGEDIHVKYTLDNGYGWNDGTTDPITLTYKVKNLNIGVVKPTEAGGFVSGTSGNGIYNPPTLKGTTIIPSKSTGLSEGDRIKVIYMLDANYSWMDGTNTQLSFIYIVEEFSIIVQKPTTAGGTVDGDDGSGAYTPPILSGTRIDYKITKGEQDELENGDTISVTYDLFLGYEWNDGSVDSITLIYTVHGLE